MLFVSAGIRKPKVFSDREALLLRYDMCLFVLLQKKKKKKSNNPKTSHSFQPFAISSWVLSTTIHVWPWEDYINIFTNTTSTNQSRYSVLFKTGLDLLGISLCLAYKHFSKNHASHCSILKKVVFLITFGKCQPYLAK